IVRPVPRSGRTEMRLCLPTRCGASREPNGILCEDAWARPQRSCYHEASEVNAYRLNAQAVALDLHWHHCTVGSRVYQLRDARHTRRWYTSRSHLRHTGVGVHDLCRIVERAETLPYLAHRTCAHLDESSPVAWFSGAASGAFSRRISCTRVACGSADAADRSGGCQWSFRRMATTHAAVADVPRGALRDDL